MGAVKFDKNKIAKLLKSENDYILDVLTNFNVPDVGEDGDMNNYLLDSKGKGAKTQANSANSVTDLEERLTSIKNKLKTKKRKVSEKKAKKQGMKKLNKNKEFKKVLLTANKTIKKEQGGASGGLSDLKDVKKMVKPIFNAEGKIVFSKFDFAAHPGSKSKKKSSSEKVVKNPQQVLSTMKDMKTKLMELEDQGDKEKAKEMKTDLAWKKAFDKIEGKKVKDDERLLNKSIKRKQDKKKKSKEQWIERKNKVEQKIQNKQKKRNENINKKLKEKKNNKLKRASKKGRVIPGF
ncbi:surfeit locus protein 6 homolog [Episyrphus balteatus]|uniref:surfeit locus protein 6 homolog n=1 Tax=Episyrphus balteatus TaxID=286459 RepID=UPI0024860837|nr:surfeit locus protein 6 homolog [Episyrphus balteatus]